MNNARKVLGNTAVQILGRLVTAALSIIILKLISTYLGKSGYGEYTTVYEFLSFFAIIADFGIFQIAVKEISRHPERRKEIFGNIFALRSILAITAMLLSIGFAGLIPQYADTAIPAGVAVAAATTFFTIIFGTISSLLQVDLRMQWNVLGLVIAKITAVVWMVATIFYVLPDNPEAGFYQLLWAGVAGGVLQVLTVLFAIRGSRCLCFRFDFALWKKILIKTLPYGAAVLLATIYVREDIILLSLLRGSEEVGLYGVAARIMENLAVISIFFLNSILPILSRLFRDNRDKLKKLIQLSFDFLMIIGLPIVVGGITLAYPIIAFVSSPEFLSNAAIGFYGSDVALQLLLIAMLFAYLGNLFGFILLAGGKQIKLMYINAIAAIFNLVANIFVIPLWGFRGASTISIISQIFVCILGFIFLRQLITDFRFRFSSVSKAIFAAIVMGGSIHFLQPIIFQVFGGNKSLLLILPIGGVIYGCILLLTKAITPEMWELLKPMEKKEDKE